LLYNALTGLTTIVGGVVAYFSLSLAEQLVPYVLAVAASSFIYIAVADLIPGLHKRPEFSATVQQIALIVLGPDGLLDSWLVPSWPIPPCTDSRVA
jgi:zinc and cadmium transporter